MILGIIIDMDVIHNAKIRIGVDPLGGAGVYFWQPIAEHNHLGLTIVNKIVDSTFSLMTVGWNGRIRTYPPLLQKRNAVMM